MQEIFNQGMALYSAGDYRGAADYLAQVFEISPHHDQAAFYLVFCFSMSGNPEKALKYAKILAARYPGYQQYTLMVSQLEQQLNKKKELVKNTFSPPLTTDSGALSKTSSPRHSPKNPDGKKMSSSSDNKPLDLAIRMIDEEQYASATQTLQKIIRAEPRNAAAMHYMAMAFFNKGDKTKAAEFFEKAIELKHCTFETCFLLASCYINLGELGKAEKYLKTALEIQNDAFAKIRLAEIYAQQGRFDEAEPLFGEIIKANPQQLDLF
ncbi:MAG: tetratricopeptide repeat protein [Candidatus Riflebacteria bacterium]|nr:tetratricopeptide repeat protein [Candidatus Riflebacteria bacterium]